ncbi:MAG: family 20 glycosylhydrolase [Tepidisphaeraceae bacterium]
MASDQDSINLLPAPRRTERTAGRSDAPLLERLDPGATHARGYLLSITPDACRIVGHDAAGVFYGRQTLAQLRRQFPASLPCLEIEDWPDFPVRGVMLDISRDKVPTMPTLFSLVDMLAGWKINQLQLYTEHTFAYRGHERVWQDAGAMTGDEVRQLDQHCKSRFIELAPNQNSFGHMERWLKHPRYLPLAEAARGSDTPWGYRWKGPFSLCPTDPASLELLADLYSQLLPNFTSGLFNVGCDETFDVGQGRSKDECRRRGVHRVYLDFLLRVNELVARHGRRMMFWGDVILKDPQLIGELPKNVIALNWGYEADHPFDAEARRFGESGVEFYVCPGTSSWCSIAGRTDNMLANQRAAAEAGLKHGAVGYLNTDWGDHGHLQYLPMSFAGLATGAALSWCLQSNRDLPLRRALDLHAFADEAGVMGRAACELGNVYKAVGKLVPNRSALFSILVPSSAHGDPMEGITRPGLDRAQAAIESAMRNVHLAKMSPEGAELIKGEFANAAAMLRYACRKARGEATPQELDRIVQLHRQCWLARNRPDGLDQSVGKLTA